MMQQVKKSREKYKRVAFAAVACLLFGLCADAAILASESFDYSGDTFIDECGGKGWAGGWFKTNDNGIPTTANSNRAVAGLDRFPDGTLGSSGQCAALDADKQRPARKFASPLDLRKDAVYYFSFVISVGNSSINNHLGFLGTDQVIGAGFREGKNGRLTARLIGGDKTQVQSKPVYLTDTPYLIVGKINAFRDATDLFHMNVYAGQQSPPAAEPPEWQFSTAGADLDCKLSGVILKQGGDTEDGKKTLYDTLRFGTTYESVVLPLQE